MVQHGTTKLEIGMAYIASKSKSQGRPGFSITFRHPLMNDRNGKPGRKVRRGLNTADLDLADTYVSQMNEILSDESWWNIAKKNDASIQFAEVVVDAFYGDIQARTKDTFEMRNELIRLPSRDDGYAHVFFVGTTGAGKTSLLRHCIGTNPDRDRFPSTSTAKTTVSDIEVIPNDGIYEAVVTFFNEFTIRAVVEECVRNASAEYWNKPEDKGIADKFLNHPEQRFRLGYLLGNWLETTCAEDDVDWSFSQEESLSIPENEENVDEGLKNENQIKLKGYIERIKSMSHPIKDRIVQDFGISEGSSSEDIAVAEDLYLEEIENSTDFSEIALDVINDIEGRFDGITIGTLKRSRSSSGWPEYWEYHTDSREDFIKNIRWFSSNYAPSFGKLLTPVVDGIRVKGPFFPDFLGGNHPKVVLYDGQGLGHTADSASSVTTHITRRFEEMDVILLVDNAQQPIQAAAQALLKSVASSGHYPKLAIAFTHFDQVKGANLPTVSDKRAHVFASVNSYLSRLKETLSVSVVNSMSNIIEQQHFVFGALDLSSNKLPPAVNKELKKLFDFFENSVRSQECPKISPEYDLTGIGFAIQKATEVYQEQWLDKLGLNPKPKRSPEHWTRVKALTRRVASEVDVEYDSLQPVADLVGQMADEISNFLDNPISWTANPSSEDEAQNAISSIRRKIYTGLHEIVQRRIVSDRLPEWRLAWDRRGSGSTIKRSLDLRSINEYAAPIPSTVNTAHSLDLMREIKELVSQSINDCGGQIV